MGKIKDYRDGFKEWLSVPAEAERVCPRCLTNAVDPVLLGSESEGHICGNCWSDDRHRDDVL